MNGEKSLAQIREKLGLIHIYCGDGKGKTTAVTGLAVRARGSGLNVLMTQFLKSGTSGELKPLRDLGVEVISGKYSQKFVFMMNEEEKAETKAQCEKRFREVTAKSREGVDLLILDEVMAAITTGMLAEQDVIDFLKTKPEHLEVALTGRGPSQALIDLADYVSEVVMRKHPYETSGLLGRKGIER
ncbi:MAG TPA: cob(I)yrinic acid a,c-diamide adenosyltransferase [Bacillota bacterium]|nr:cob(I)yrinic acid a,c-diamide adenosyltransferase [Bacillota bacterium]